MSCSCRLIVCVEMTIFGAGDSGFCFSPLLLRFSASRSVAARIAGTR